MTPTRWSAMSARERDAYVAEKVMGWEYPHQQKGEWYGYAPCSPRPIAGGGTSSHDGFRSYIPHYTANHFEAYEVEEKIREMGLIKSYLDRLQEICSDPETVDLPTYQNIFAQVHASPDSRCLAAVQAKEGSHD